MSVKGNPERGGGLINDSLHAFTCLPDVERNSDGYYEYLVPNNKIDEVRWLLASGSLADLLPPIGTVLCEAFVNTEPARLDRVRFRTPNYVGLKYHDDAEAPWVYVTLGFHDELGLVDSKQDTEGQIICVGIELTVGNGGKLVAGRDTTVYSASEWLKPLLPDDERAGTFDDIKCIRSLVDALARQD